MLFTSPLVHTSVAGVKSMNVTRATTTRNTIIILGRHFTGLLVGLSFRAKFPSTCTRAEKCQIIIYLGRVCKKAHVGKFTVGGIFPLKYYPVGESQQQQRRNCRRTCSFIISSHHQRAYTDSTFPVPKIDYIFADLI